MGKASRDKGARGMTAAKRLLLDRDYSIDAHITAGVKGVDILATDTEGVSYAIEVKKCKALMLEAWLGVLAARPIGNRKYRLMAHLPRSSQWLIFTQGQGYALWREKK